MNFPVHIGVRRTNNGIYNTNGASDDIARTVKVRTWNRYREMIDNAPQIGDEVEFINNGEMVRCKILRFYRNGNRPVVLINHGRYMSINPNRIKKIWKKR